MKIANCKLGGVLLAGLCGCAGPRNSQEPRANSGAESPAATKRQEPAGPAIVPARQWKTVAFVYSTNAPFYAVQETTNLVDWTTLPELVNCAGAPNTNSDLWVTNDLKSARHFWRVLPHKGWW